MEQRQQLALEAVKLLKEWSSWMITVELAIIAFLGSSYLRNGEPLQGWMVSVIIFFGISITAAAWVLGALPWIVVNLDIPRFANPYQAELSTAPILAKIRLWMMGFVQQAFFIVGILVLALGLLGVFPNAEVRSHLRKDPDIALPNSPLSLEGESKWQTSY